MTLVTGKDFWQAEVGRRYALVKNLEEQPGGACFRLAFKWLMCKLYNKPFKNYDAKLTGRPELTAGNVKTNVNEVKTYGKQQKYLNSMSPYEEPGTSYDVFLTGVRKESKHYMEIWGNKEGKYSIKVADRECLSMIGERRLNADGSFIIGIAGKSINTTKSTGVAARIMALKITENWAHAFAFYRKGTEVRFFDSNGGEYDVAGEDPALAIIRHADAYYTGYEKVYGFSETPVGTAGFKQFERDLTNLQFTKTEDGFKSILNYLLFEVTKKV
jgi:hypothetical protein